MGGKQVLECGCGAGRFSEVLLAQGAKVTSIDLSSDSVTSNAINFPVNGYHRIAQADIRKLPFRKRSFDVVLALGVVQHTPSPEQAIAELYEQVAIGVSCDGSLLLSPSDSLLRRLPCSGNCLKRLPPPTAFGVTDKLVDVLLPLHKKTHKIPILRSVVARISPVLSYYRSCPQLSDALQYEWALLDTHDVLTDYYKHFRTVTSIRRTLKQLGMQNVLSQRGGNGIGARGRRLS